jgi:hypothetical protein
MAKTQKTEKPLVNKKYLLKKAPGKGGWTYIIISEIVRVKGKPLGRVKGKIDDCEIKQFGLLPLKNGKILFPVNSQIRKKIGKKEGDWVHVILYIDSSPVKIPKELLICLKDEPVAYQTFLSYPKGEQRYFINWINSAKRDETKVERIAKTLDKLAKRQRFGNREERNAQ